MEEGEEWTQKLVVKVEGLEREKREMEMLEVVMEGNPSQTEKLEVLPKAKLWIL